MKNASLFLKWVISAALIALGSVAAVITGVADAVADNDVTRISFMIYIVFILSTIYSGFLTYKLSHLNEFDDLSAEEFSSRNNYVWFISDILTTMGMIGTVLGFIYMLGSSFGEIDPSNTIAMSGALSKMGVGMSSALYTTAAGLICSTFLKVQAFIADNRIDQLSRKYCR